MEQEQAAFISAVHLKGYKSIRDVAVDLKQGLNIIIGANGSGKTNFLEFLNAAYRSDFEYLLNGKKVEWDIKGEPYSVSTKGERTFQSNLIAYRVEEIKSLSKSKKETTYFLDEEKKVIDREEKTTGLSLLFLISTLGKTLYVRFENPMNIILKEKLSLSLSRQLGNISKNDIPKQLNFFYSNLKTSNGFTLFLNEIFSNYKQIIDNNESITNIINEITENKWFEIDLLRQNLKQFSPIKDIKIDWELTRRTIQKEDDDSETASIEGFDFQFFVNNEWINWSKLSDGTKRLFYLIGSVTYARKDNIILMEEPELGVHPHQLTLLMNFLKAQSLEKQIIISTHSPQVLNCLKEDELDRIIVARHEGKLGTKMYHLSEEEKGYASEYMQNQAFLSDYWLQSGFVNEETEDIL